MPPRSHARSHALECASRTAPPVGTRNESFGICDEKTVGTKQRGRRAKTRWHVAQRAAVIELRSRAEVSAQDLTTADLPALQRSTSASWCRARQTFRPAGRRSAGTLTAPRCLPALAREPAHHIRSLRRGDDGCSVQRNRSKELLARQRRDVLRLGHRLARSGPRAARWHLVSLFVVTHPGA